MKPTQNQTFPDAPRSICPVCTKPATHGLPAECVCCDEGRIAAYSCGEHMWLVQWEAAE